MVVYLTEIVPPSVRSVGVQSGLQPGDLHRRIHPGSLHLADPRHRRQGDTRGVADRGGDQRARRRALSESPHRWKCALIASRTRAQPMTLTLADIQAAAGRIAGHVERTPCRYSRTLSQITGAEVWVKFENQQFTASYKERGALNRLSQLTEAERRLRGDRGLRRKPRPGISPFTANGSVFRSPSSCRAARRT